MPDPGPFGRNLLVGPHALRVWRAVAAPILAGDPGPATCRNRLNWRGGSYRKDKRRRNKARRRAIKLGRRREAV